jgi:ankyrin repeat protein
MKHHSLDILAYLLRHGLDVNAKNDRGGTAVFLAAETGNIAAIKMLLQHGADLTFEADNTDTAFMIANRRDNSAVVELFLDNGLQLEARYMADSNTALTLAVDHGSINVAKLLLKRGADVHAVNDGGNTPLHLAVCNNIPELISLLLQSGADVNARSSAGYTPISFTVSAPISKMSCQLLLDAGADLTTTTAKGLTLLHGIEDTASSEVLQLLLDQDAMKGIIHEQAANCDCCGQTSAIMVCRQPAQFKLLVAAGADVHRTTDLGNTALHIAVLHKHPAPILCLLIKAGVDLFAVNSMGVTAAELAQQCGNDLAAALLKRSETGP